MSILDAYRLNLVTEDSVSFSVQLASPILRAFALGIDLIIVMGTMSIVRIALMVFQLFAADLHDALFVLISFVVSVGYFMLFEWAMHGQTFGKKIMGLRVMDASARRLTPSQIVVRNLFRTIDMFPFFYFLGGVVALQSRKCQRLGDKVASTLVVRTQRRAHPLVRNLSEVKYNSLRAHPRLESTLRKAIGPEEASLLVHALLRRDELAADKRVLLYAALAENIKTQLPADTEVLKALGDEALIRNCVDSLYFNRRKM